MYLEKSVPVIARDAYRRDALGGMLVGVFCGAIFPFIAFIARDKLHASVTLIGLITAAPSLGSMLSLFYAHLMEGRKKMPYVVVPWVVARSLFMFTIFATTPLTFTILVTIILALNNIIHSGYAAIMKEIYPDESRGRIMAYIRVGVAFTMFIATQIVGELLHIVKYEYIFAISSLLGVLSALVFGTIKTNPITKEEIEEKRVSGIKFLIDTMSLLKTNKTFRWFMISTFIFGFGNIVAVTIYPIYQVDKLHINSFQVAVLTNISTIVWMVSFPYWGKYVDIKSPIKAVNIAIILASLIPINYFFATSPWALIPSSILGGVSLACMELSYFNSVMHLADHDKISQYQSLHAFNVGLRGITAPFLATITISIMQNNGTDMKYIFPACCLVMLAGFILIKLNLHPLINHPKKKQY